MKRMSQECVSCLYTSDHPFGLTFNDDGLCSGCVTHQEKFDLDWDHRFELLRKKSNPIARNPGKANMTACCRCAVRQNTSTFLTW